MTHRPGQWHPLGRTRHEDLQILAAGGDTGWWDETGRPAPWPQDFLDPQAGWTTAAPDSPPLTSTGIGPHHPPF